MNLYRDVRSVVSYPLNDAGLSWSGRLESNQHEKGGNLPRSHYATPALISQIRSQRGDYTKLATVAEVESAARGFGDRCSTATSRPIWGDRRVTIPRRLGPQPSAVPPGYDHHNHLLRRLRTYGARAKHMEPPAGFEPASPRYKGGSLPLTYDGSNWRIGRHSKSHDCHTRAAVYRLAYRPSTLARTKGLEPSRT